MGWNIGANDTANCIGTTVGCGLLNFRRAVIIVSLFTILGAVLQGHHVMETVGKGIVRSELGYLAVLIALLCSGFFVTLATFFRIPTSTSQAIVGGVLGIGLATGSSIDYSKVITIIESWVLCPVLILVLAFLLLRFVNLLLQNIGLRSFMIQNLLGWLTILASCYLAYSMGANNAGNAMGPIANLGILPPRMLLIVGGLAIAVGALTYGEKVSETVGKEITPLDIPSAFCAQCASAVGLHLFSVLGIPVSTSTAIVGAVVGAGLVKGTGAVNSRTILTILVGWVLTPTLAALTSFLLYFGITNVL
ncbi:MAG: inorganic phosphate transporter family protein [Desulfohalobiaceae bacterium]|nr:inorganic phosphate transporter family protein [Desulfohalobiaceae bacterium]